MSERAIWDRVKRMNNADGNSNPSTFVLPNAGGANYNITVNKIYFTQVTATGVFTKIADAALNAALQTALPLYLYAPVDMVSGYAKLRALMASSNANWSFAECKTYGYQVFESFDSTDTTVTAELQTGDVVEVYKSALPGAGTITYALIIIRCEQTAYASIQASILGADKFTIDTIRLTVADDTVAAAQFANSFLFLKQSIFGQTLTDTLPVQTSVTPYQFNKNITDLKVNDVITKEKGLAVQMAYACPRIQLTYFAQNIVKA